ncbi:MAG: HAMP domain-containing histidine kinase [Oscillochloris sp.]|nr:HAMP domain-containing histidine kinase [Oscillochloris sp.]
MTTSPQPFANEVLYQLSPNEPQSYRQLRYDGGAMSVSIDTFTPNDQAVIRRVYAALSTAFTLLRNHQSDPDINRKLGDLYQTDKWSELIAAMHGLESANLPNQSERIHQVIHDLRGGAFQAIALQLQFIGSDIDLGEDVHRIFFLARDQLKIMRNTIPDLDRSGTARDAEQRLHHIELIVEKWQRSDYRLIRGQAEVHVRSAYTGAIAERCLEFSALDRVIYNLINNATTYSADHQVDVDILPLPQDEPHHLRFVISNRINDEQRRTLNARFPDGPGALFKGGFTTGGSGMGLRICADFVCNAYGLNTIEQGLAEGHFGARIHDDYFLSWIHWPLAGD